MTASLLAQQLRTVTLPDGRRALVLEPVIPDDAPTAVREGIARRHLVNSGRRCPCGAAWPRLNRADRRRMREPGTVVAVPVEHATDCPAGDDVLTSAVEAWRAGETC